MDESQEPIEPDYQKLAEFRYLLRHFLIFSEKAAAQSGLTAKQHQALLAIKGWGGPGPVTAGLLAERLGIKPHSAVGLIDRLAAKGLVLRKTSEDDRRQVRILATPAAEVLLASLSKVHWDEIRRLAPLLKTLLDALG